MNSPLGKVDQNGLYETDGLTGDQKELLKAAIKLTGELRDKYEKGSTEYKRIDAALTAIGTEGDKNGVTIKVGGDDPNSGHTEVTKKGITIVLGNNTLKAPQNLLAKPEVNSGLIGTLVHEGTHASDGQAWIKNGTNISTFDAEMNAFLAQTNVQTKLFELMKEKSVIKGSVSQSVTYGDREDTDEEIYEPGWTEADTKTALTTYLKKAPAYGLTPESKDMAFPTDSKKKGRK